MPFCHTRREQPPQPIMPWVPLSITCNNLQRSRVKLPFLPSAEDPEITTMLRACCSAVAAVEAANQSQGCPKAKLCIGPGMLQRCPEPHAGPPPAGLLMLLLLPPATPLLSASQPASNTWPHLRPMKRNNEYHNYVQQHVAT